MGTRYWAMRTDRGNPEYFFQELRQGRMRQGWGWLPEQDLRKIQQLRQQGKSLTQEQKQAWKGRRLLETEWDGVQNGDFVILPNLPKYGEWLIAKVEGPYYFDIDPKQNDYGHIRTVRLLNPEKPINPYSEKVSATLRSTMKARNRLWNIDWAKDSVEKIVKSIEAGDDLSKPESQDEKILSIYKEVEKKIYEIIFKKYQGGEFQYICSHLLKSLYGEDNVEIKHGSNEEGADFICSLQDPLGDFDFKIAVQVKMWWGKANDLHPLDQIKEAYNAYGIDAGVILTLLDELSPEFIEAQKKIEKELKIPIDVLRKEETIYLLVDNLVGMMGK